VQDALGNSLGTLDLDLEQASPNDEPSEHKKAKKKNAKQGCAHQKAPSAKLHAFIPIHLNYGFP
jgi:hypothetical protein